MGPAGASDQQLLQPEEDHANSAGDIEENPLCGSGVRSQRGPEQAQWDREQLLRLQA